MNQAPITQNIQSKTILHVCRIKNQTPFRIGIQALKSAITNKTANKCQYTLIIPPFSHKDIQVPEFDRPKFRETYDLAEWEDLGIIKVIHDPDRLLQDNGNPWTVPLGYGVLVITLWLTLAFPLALLQNNETSNIFLREFLTLINISLVTIGLFVLTLLLARLAGRKEVTRKLLRNTLFRIGTWFQKSPYVLIVLLIGWGIPAFALLSLNQDVFSSDSASSLLSKANLWELLVAWVFIGLASTFPALMYLLFGRQQLDKVHKSFIQTTLMLDPALINTDEAEQKYSSLMEDVHGTSNLGNLNQFRGAATPFLVSTLLITIGWILTLLPDVQNQQLDDILRPQANPIIFGFLGAYFFAINMVFRRYVRGDLTPKAYIHITFRFIVTILLVWTITAFASNMKWSSESILAIVAFIIGIVPETGTTIIQDYYRKLRLPFDNNGKNSDLGLKEEYPLTELDGISVYDRARFQEEGINNIVNLVYHDLIDLIARTRVPTHRLIDLYDQAILYLHLSRNEVALEKALQMLRSYGIRTGTDLLIAFAEFPDIENVFATLWESNPVTVSGLDEHVLDSNLTVLPRLQVICHSISDHDWIDYLLKWRKLQSQTNQIKNLAETLNLT